MSLLGNENFASATKPRCCWPPWRLVSWWGTASCSKPGRLLYEPTAFLVGLADDYTRLEVADQLDAQAPGWREDATKIDPEVAGDVGRRGLLATRPIGIDPEGASVRIMGVRS